MINRPRVILLRLLLEKPANKIHLLCNCDGDVVNGQTTLAEQVFAHISECGRWVDRISSYTIALQVRGGVATLRNARIKVGKSKVKIELCWWLIAHTWRDSAVKQRRKHFSCPAAVWQVIHSHMSWRTPQKETRAMRHSYQDTRYFNIWFATHVSGVWRCLHWAPSQAGKRFVALNGGLFIKTVWKVTCKGWK